MPMLNFATLGPEDGDHACALREYLAVHGIDAAASVNFFESIDACARALAEAKVDYMLQGAFRPLAAQCIRSDFVPLHVVDAFVAPDIPMALVRARHAPANDNRVAVSGDLRRQIGSRWNEVVPEPTVLAVQQGLMSGRYAAGVVRMSFALAHTTRWQVLEPLDLSCTAWIMFGRVRADRGEAVVWRDSPIALHYWLASDRASAGSGGCARRGGS